MWMAPKGLGEIEEMEHEEVSVKMMQSLERFMRSHPSVWSESSVQHLLVEVADTRYASLPTGEAEERVRTIINRILVPMANIIDGEQGFLTTERQRIQEATLALQRVQQECHVALGDLKQDHDLSRRDLRKLAKALEENRQAAEEARIKLSAKEEQIQEILQKQTNLVVRLVCGGPSEFRRWATEEIESRNLADLYEELERVWCGDPDQALVISDQSCNYSIAKQSSEVSLSSWMDPKEREKWTSFHKWTSVAVQIVCVVGWEVVAQAGESCGRVRSILSVPFVIAGFWIGLARRLTLLAFATLFPELGMVGDDGTTPSTKEELCLRAGMISKPEG